LKLALDTSQASGSLALWDAGRVVYSACFDISITHSETLMPQVDHALRFCGFIPGDLEAVLLTIGPGSFTGLRIGLATAKGIAYGLNVPLLPFSTLMLCALERRRCGRNILAVLNAKMKECYAALYDEELVEMMPPRVVKPEEIPAWEIDGAYLLGSGAALLDPEALAAKGLVPVPAAPLNAAGLFTLEQLFPPPKTYDFTAIAELEPQYLRESTAQIRKN